jgi:hypothetical protein
LDDLSVLSIQSMARQRYTVEEVAAALRACNGLLFLAGERLGCCGKTVERYVQRYASLREQVRASRERRVDIAEGMLDKAVLNGEPWAIRLTLVTIGRGRGFGESVELVLKRAFAQVEGMTDEELVAAYSARRALDRNGDSGPVHNGRAEPPAAADG